MWEIDQVKTLLRGLPLYVDSKILIEKYGEEIVDFHSDFVKTYEEYLERLEGGLET